MELGRLTTGTRRQAVQRLDSFTEPREVFDATFDSANTNSRIVGHPLIVPAVPDASETATSGRRSRARMVRVGRVLGSARAFGSPPGVLT